MVFFRSNNSRSAKFWAFFFGRAANSKLEVSVSWLSKKFDNIGFCECTWLLDMMIGFLNVSTFRKVTVKYDNVGLEVMADCLFQLMSSVVVAVFQVYFRVVCFMEGKCGLLL